MGDRKQGTWRREVISAGTEQTLRVLSEAKLVDGFYLAGGTGLALRFGHRLSMDLDFLNPEHFDEDAFLERLQVVDHFALAAKAPYTIHATVEQTKVSFLGYAYPLLFPVETFAGVSVADARDIACMKVTAIASRGARRDFVDLYVSARHFGLDEILRLFDRKYARLNFSKVHLLKSFTFFADAEKDPMPHMLEGLDWEKVRQFFLREAPRLLRGA